MEENRKEIHKKDVVGRKENGAKEKRTHIDMRFFT
jgi:hypothetical protein